ncbi:hypothetical protein LWI28_007575 [Acer negundo]|uniref:Uncharacterized protein n=1 Tax=Acer negundo TaxID=4023 RepID=A0AAD5IY86_ACENE|nr:hypothetical protein LWI28_007575 [Acer negundo]
MAFLSVKSRQLPAVSFGSPTFLSLLPAKPPQQLSFPAAMLPSSAATYKLVAVPSKPYWSSVCLMCRSKGDEEVDKNDMESPFIVILCLMAIALIIGNGETGGGDESSGPRQAEKQDDPDTTIEFLKDILHSVELTIKENKFEEVERVADYILNLIIGRYDAETGRRKGSRDGAEAGRRETGGGPGGSEGSGSRRAEKPKENDLKYQKIERISR